MLLTDGAAVLPALLAAHLLRGAVAGRVSSVTPASNGVVTAALCAPVGVGWLLWAVPPFTMLPGVDPFTGGSLDAGMFSFWAVGFSVFVLLALLAGYLGGRLGGRLRSLAGGEGPPA